MTVKERGDFSGRWMTIAVVLCAISSGHPNVVNFAKHGGHRHQKKIDKHLTNLISILK